MKSISLRRFLHLTVATLALCSFAMQNVIFAADIPCVINDESVVIHDQAIMKSADFSFGRTIGAILTSMKIADTSQARIDFVNTLIASFKSNEHINLRSGLLMKVDQRPAEASLTAEGMLSDPEIATNLDALQPIGLFNRMDLMPADASDCGEHRIVYSLAHPTKGRFFLIFEANVPNPSSGEAGCKPISDFWASMSLIADPSKKAKGLEQFFYKGLGNGIGPVVDAHNYGLTLGQIRGNLFLTPKWQLREWQIHVNGKPSIAEFLPVTVKNNPLAELYSDGNLNSLDPVKEAAVRQEFQTKFIAEYLNDLKSEDEKVGATIESIIGGIGSRKLDDKFNEFQSDAGNSDNPTNLKGSNFNVKIAAALQQTPTIDSAAMLNRAGAITCGGCHLFSGGQPIGKLNGQTINWPSAIFTHIAEPNPVTGISGLSDALTTAFLPSRKKALEKLSCTTQTADAFKLIESDVSKLRREIDAKIDASLADRTLFKTKSDQAKVAQQIEQLRIQSLQQPGLFVEHRRSE